MSVLLENEREISESEWTRNLSSAVIFENGIGEKLNNFNTADKIVTSLRMTAARVSNTDPRLVRIVQVQNSFDLSWFVPLVRSNRVVRGTDSQQIWTSWNPIHKNDAFVYVFGLPDPENDGQFLYAFGDENDNLVRLMTGSEPANEIDGPDVRLFRHLVSIVGQRNILQHVVSGKYVAVSEISSNRLVLRDSEEEASEVMLEFQ